MKTMMIENTTDHAIRFNSVVKFYPKQPVKVTEDMMNKFPAIKILIERGEFKVVKAAKEKAAKEDMIEDV